MPLLGINTKGLKSLYKEASVLRFHGRIINNSQHTESNYPKLDEWVVQRGTYVPWNTIQYHKQDVLWSVAVEVTWTALR